MENVYYTGLIIKIPGKQKYFELMDGLVPPFPEHYAMTQGAVGAKFAPNSGIRMAITEYNSSNVVTKKAKALIPTYVWDDIAFKCRLAGSYTYASNFHVTKAVWAFLRETIGGMKAVSSGEINMTEAFGKIAQNVFCVLKGKDIKSKDGPFLPLYDKEKLTPDEENPYFPSLGKSRKASPYETIKICPEYNYSQVRVHPYKENPSKCNCDMATIYRDTVDTESKKPWVISISNFDATTKYEKNGTTSYINPINKTDTIMRLSDDEMSHCCSAVKDFHEMWKMSQVKNFANGKKLTDEQRIAAANAAKDSQ